MNKNLEHKKIISTMDLTKMGLLVALLSVSAYITIPLAPIPLTLQTFLINIIALLLTPWQAFFSVLVYILLGAVGLPVFSGAIGGLGKLFGPTGGFIFGFLIAAPIISFTQQKLSVLFQKVELIKKWKEKNKTLTASFLSSLICTLFIGIPIIYLVGSVYMKFLTGMTWEATVAAAVLPFIPLDMLKAVAACLLVVPIKQALSKN